MRKMTLAAFAAAAGLALGASQAQATQFVGTWSLNYASADPGLVVHVEAITPNLDFTLSAAHQVEVIPLFKIWTEEAAVNHDPGRPPPRPRAPDNDDIIAQPITLTFNFTSPTPNDVPPVEGDTNGVHLNGGLSFFPPFIILPEEYGVLDWDGAGLDGTTAMNYGVGDPRGLLSISVNGGQFNRGFFDLDPGEGEALTVYGTFDWDRDPTPFRAAVPEPASWALMIGGFGLAGASLRRRRAVTA